MLVEAGAAHLVDQLDQSAVDRAIETVATMAEQAQGPAEGSAS